MSDSARAFADHLNELEATGDVDRFVARVFADDVELVRPEAQQQLRGDGGAHTFWRQYLAHFESIRSEFSRLVDTDQLSVLEWRSAGQLRNGGPIAYHGVSILDLDADGKVRRFATYYDTAPFHAPALGAENG